MTREEKELLLKDLCARLPYGVKVQIKAINCIDGISTLNPIDLYSFIEDSPRDINWYDVVISIRPYLRPMSSMTKEEKEEYGKVCELDTEILANQPMKGEPFPALYNSQDWLNKHHFDYRGLIPRGRAIEVTEDNNPYK